MTNKLDKPAFEKLFKALYVPLCRYCCQFVRNSAIAEEIVQDKFLQLWEKRNDLQIHKSYESFLYTAIRNQSIDYLRSRAAKLVYKHEELSEDLRDDFNPLKALEYKEFENKIDQILETLPEKCFIIFSLKRFGGLSNAEIAEELKITEKTVLNQMTKAKKLVKEAIVKLKY